VDVTEIVKKPRADRRRSATGTIRIVLADDRHVVREAIKCLLEAERDFEVVGEVDDGLAVAPLVERLRPHIVILDVAIPGLFGLEVTRQVRQRAPQTAVIVLSHYVNEWYVGEALRNGAAGYVAQRAQARELIRAVRTVAQGERYLSAPMSMDDLETWLTGTHHAGDPYETLTGREREVLQLVAEGNSSTRVARRLTISVRTAEAHRANVMRKLHLKNHTALIRYALARGVLPPLEPLPPGFRVARRRRPTAQ
jgi:two-component system, NarL family, response regulator NreC